MPKNNINSNKFCNVIMEVEIHYGTENLFDLYAEYVAKKISERMNEQGCHI